MKYRKKPVEIEAFQIETAHDYLHEKNPAWFSDAIEAKTVFVKIYGSEVIVHIHTLEGVMTSSTGDWIIRGVVGELYSCQDDVFKMTYELVEEEGP